MPPLIWPAATFSLMEKGELSQRLNNSVGSSKIDRQRWRKLIEKNQQQRETEEGVVVPVEQIDPVTLRNLVTEFVTREWTELTDGGSSLESQVQQVLRQLKEGKVLIVFDLKSETCNLVPKESLPGQLLEQ